MSRKPSVVSAGVAESHAAVFTLVAKRCHPVVAIGAAAPSPQIRVRQLLISLGVRVVIAFIAIPVVPEQLLSNLTTFSFLQWAVQMILLHFNSSLFLDCELVHGKQWAGARPWFKLLGPCRSTLVAELVSTQA
eukprot:3938817-Rhodomonas_salina.1